MTAATEVGRRAAPLPYDFRRPSKFNREHVRALQIANETFCRQFTTVLSTTLRAVSQVSLTSVNQLTYDEYIRDIPNPSFLAILTLEPLSGRSVFHVPLPLAMTAIDCLLGGVGGGVLPDRSLTDIEDGLMRNLMVRILRELSYAFESLGSITASVVQQESNPQFAQIASATDMVVVMTYDIRIGTTQGEVTLAIPFSSLQPLLDAVTGNALLAGRVPSDPHSVRRALEERVDNVPVDVHVSFNEVTLSSGEIVELRPGDVLPLLHGVDAPLAVCVAGIACFAAVPGRKGKRLACLVVDPHAATTPGSAATAGRRTTA